MPATRRPREFTDCTFDGDSIEIPSGGVSLQGCVFRELAWPGKVIPAFFAKGCRFDSCNFVASRFGGGYFGGGEGAGFGQTAYRQCRFDRADLEPMSFGSARFEQCSFRDVQLRKWLSFSAEFVDCVFAGEIAEAVFLGRSPLSSRRRQKNEFRGNDFSKVKLARSSFAAAST